MQSSRIYLPAAGRDWRLPLYDPFVKLVGGDAARRALLDQVALRPGTSGSAGMAAHRLTIRSAK